MKINKNGNYKSNTIKFFDRVAEKNHGDSFKHYKIALKWMESIKVDKVLDLGTGRGDLIEEIRKNPNYKNLDIYGVDISENMIKKSISKGIDAKFSVGDSENIKFNDGYFDLELCINSFHHYENIEKSVKEMSRVLKKGGVLILGEIYLPNILSYFINKLLPYGTTGDYKIYSSEELKNIFKNENLYLEKQVYTFPSIKTYMFRKG